MTFVTVTQISASQFDVEFIQAKSITEVRSEKGILIALMNRGKENEKHCFQLAEKMNAQ